MTKKIEKVKDKHPGGRPTDYSEKILEITQKYIEECKDEYVFENRGLKVNLPTIEGLAYELKVHKDTIYEWRKIHKEFSDLIGDLLSKQAKSLINMGLSGDYNPTIAKVLLSKHGYKEVTEIDATVTANPYKDLTAEELRKLVQ